MAPTEYTVSFDLACKRNNLLAQLRQMGGCAVAFSGGIDSTVVAKAAHVALGDAAVAVTADSPSVARSDLDDARRLGAPHRIAPPPRRRPPAGPPHRHPPRVRRHGGVRQPGLRAERRQPLLLLQRRAV